MQRISAAIMGVFAVIFLLILLVHPAASYGDWKALMAHSWVKVGMLLFLLSLFLHAWVGMRDILMDYVHRTGIRLALQVLVLMSLAVYAIWAVRILWGN